MKKKHLKKKGGHPPPVTRAMLSASGTTCLNRGRVANADVFKVMTPDGSWVVKDFRKCPCLIRWTFGRYMAGHEYRLLKRLEGIRGVPQRCFRLDAYAVGMEFLKGTTVSATKGPLPKDYFLRLEKLMKRVNARGVAHLDTRNAKNVMVLANGSPALVDFQAGFVMSWLPRPLRNLLEHTDLSGVYKHWFNKNRDSLDEARKEVLREHFRWRRLWMFKGYTFLKRREPKGAEKELLAEKQKH